MQRSDLLEAIVAVRSGKVDFLAADMTPNAKRTLVLSFTEPYLYSDVVLYAKKSKGFASWEDASWANLVRTNPPLLDKLGGSNHRVRAGSTRPGYRILLGRGGLLDGDCWVRVLWRGGGQRPSGVSDGD